MRMTIVTIAVGALSLGLSACGGGETATNESGDVSATESDAVAGAGTGTATNETLSVSETANGGDVNAAGTQPD